jgi:hypothetical protein
LRCGEVALSVVHVSHCTTQQQPPRHVATSQKQQFPLPAPRVAP